MKQSFNLKLPIQIMAWLKEKKKNTGVPVTVQIIHMIKYFIELEKENTQN